MPSPLVNIIINLLTNQSNRVITNFGLTQSYKVQDGIDQGETITPLLWRIYYDPLISKIFNTYTGYTSTTTWTTTIAPPIFDKTEASTSVLAYMDDTLWIAQSFQQLQQILQTASSFYQMANIRVNSYKSVLVSNTNQLPLITFLNSSIQTKPDR